MFRRILLIAGLMLSLQTASAQEWEVGGWLGASGYIGDLNPENPSKFTDPAASIFVRYAYSEFSGLKLAFTYGHVSADDADSPYEQHRLRNLNFHSDILELGLTYEYYFQRYVMGSRKHRFSPYTFVGISGFYFEPKTELNGQTYFLRKLNTEGQGTSAPGAKKAYGNINMAIPFGIGIKYNFASNFNIGLELGYRNTFTDYLDDVSGKYADKMLLATERSAISSDLSDRSGEVNNGIYAGETGALRGDPSRRDFYMFTGVTFSYTFTPIKCPDLKLMR
jgi:hypothetical protein